jgi:hypothetical protein
MRPTARAELTVLAPISSECADTPGPVQIWRLGLRGARPNTSRPAGARSAGCEPPDLGGKGIDVRVTGAERISLKVTHLNFTQK